MATIMYLRNGAAYRVADSLTLQQVNDKLNSDPNRFVSVPLHPESATNVGTPGAGQAIQGLYITPDSVSHFVVI